MNTLLTGGEPALRPRLRSGNPACRVFGGELDTGPSGPRNKLSAMVALCCTAPHRLRRGGQQPMRQPVAVSARAFCGRRIRDDAVGDVDPQAWSPVSVADVELTRVAARRCTPWSP